MSVLSNLKLSDTSPRAKLSPVARKRQKLLEQLDLQLKAAAAFVMGQQFLQEVQRWVRVEGSADKQLITKKKPVRPWWWRNDVGRLMLSVRAGNRLLELAEGKVSIDVGTPEDLQKTIETLREAVAAGELDEQLSKNFARPVPPKKAAKS
jgi:hypothetical protein